MKPVGIGDLVDVVRVLDLRGEQIATAAELLRLQPRAQLTVTAAPAGMPLTVSTEKLVLLRLAR